MKGAYVRAADGREACLKFWLFLEFYSLVPTDPMPVEFAFKWKFELVLLLRTAGSLPCPNISRINVCADACAGLLTYI